MKIMKPKHKCTRTAFSLPRAFPQIFPICDWEVIPFDGENPPKKLNIKPSMSWSAGFTHYYVKDNPNMIGFCGKEYFENWAKKI